MSPDAYESIETTKKFLLKYNPSKIGPDNQQEILQRFVDCSKQLFVYFQEKTSGISDSLGLLATDTFSIWVLRTSQVIANKNIDTSGYLKVVRDEILTVERSTTIFEYVIDFWMHGNPAFINALKDLFTKLLHLIRLIHPTAECDKLFGSWLDKTLQVPSDLPVQYYLIEALAEELDLYPVLQNRPHFVQDSLCLMQSDLLSNPIGKSLSKILINVFRNHFSADLSHISLWLDLWQGPVAAQLPDSNCRKAIELYVLEPVFRETPPEVFTAFVERLRDQKPSVVLSVVRVGQELSIEDEPFHNNRLISLATIDKFLKLDEFKLAAFELLTFSPKKSSPIHSYVFDLIKENLTVFFVDTRIEVRNYFCSAFKHFIYRIRDSASSLHKSASSLKKAKKFPTEQEVKFKYVQDCKVFLEWLLNLLKLQICPGTQYQRNDVALKLLTIIIESGLDKSISQKYLDMKNSRAYPFSVSVFRDESMIRLLLDCLASVFADIRQMAKRLLLMALEGSDASILRERIDWSHLKDQASLFLEQYQYSDIGAALESVRYFAAPDKVAFVNSMVDNLQEKVRNSKRDYLRHINEPISGYLTSLALILDENHLEESSMKPIIAKCINIIFTNWDAVKHVICHESCEENLWMMYPDGDIDAQLVLSTAFRTTKESSTLLRVLLLKYALCSEQLVAVGDFLIEQLFDIRHSGAFQSVTPTFSTLCLRCKRENGNQLMAWLKVIMESVQVKTQNVTRRSGGIPPMLAVILSAESGKERPLLKYAFDGLIEIASTSIEEHQDKVDLPQVNAFNCIKAIFTESKLSQACDPYTSPALSLALENFDSDTWALRNCSIMLFTSLQNRLFGKSGKSVSARMFFTRYPGIREHLLGIMQHASTAKEGSQIESIFLGLTILLRLKPTPGYKGLDAFNDEVKKSLTSSNWKVRELAARSISSLTENPIDTAKELIEKMNVNCQNTLHGYLLATNDMMPSLRTFKLQHLSPLINELLIKCDKLLGHNNCFLTAKTYINLMEDVLKLADDGLFQDQRRKFLCCLGHYFTEHSKQYAVDGSKQICLAAALEVLLKNSQDRQLAVLLEQAIVSSFYEVQKAALTFILSSTDALPHITSDTIHKLKGLVIDEQILPLVSSLSLRTLKKLNQKIDVHQLLNMIENPRSEGLQLAAIEALGTSVPPNDLKILETVSWKFSADNQPVDFRFACFQGLKEQKNARTNSGLVLLLDRMLSDDDEDIRLSTASYVNQAFSLTGDDEAANPGETSRLLSKQIASLFDKKSLSESVSELLRDFLGGYDLFAPEARSNCVFETEKDNQFRNDFEQNMKYAKLLQISGFDDKFEAWLVSLKNSFIASLQSTELKDVPFGWASSGDVFSRLLVLRSVLTLIDPSHLSSFDQALIQSNVHPFILNQTLSTSIDLSANLKEMTIS